MSAQTPFTIIYADPAWEYDDQLTMSATKRGAATNYPTMSVQQICDLYQPAVYGARQYARPNRLAGHTVADNAICLLWVTKDILLEGIGQRVLNTWGFTPKQIVPWVKGRIDVEGGVQKRTDGDTLFVEPRLVLQTGMGRIYRNVVEYLLVGARGKYTQLVLDKGQNGLIFEEEVILEPRGKHSAKPASMYPKIERMFPGPYLELFARNTRPGWTSWGNELALAEGEQPTPISITTDGDGVKQVYVQDVQLHVPEAPVVRPGVHPETTIEWP